MASEHGEDAQSKPPYITPANNQWNVEQRWNKDFRVCPSEFVWKAGNRGKTPLVETKRYRNTFLTTCRHNNTQSNLLMGIPLFISF